MKRTEEKRERTIIFFHEGAIYPSIKRGYFTDSDWRDFLFKRFDSHERDYIWVNDVTILIQIEKGN